MRGLGEGLRVAGSWSVIAFVAGCRPADGFAVFGFALVALGFTFACAIGFALCAVAFFATGFFVAGFFVAAFLAAGFVVFFAMIISPSRSI
jgi:hypothetical protein